MPEPETTVHASLPPNPWGLYEVHGNAREWCSDGYDDQGYPPGPAIDPVGPPADETHCVRGGPSAEAPNMLRAPFRIGLRGDDEVRNHIGSRVAASVPAE